MKKNTFTFFFLFFALFTQIYAQIPSGYYNTVNEKKGKELQIALNGIINGHRSVSYTEVWTYYQYTDLKPNGKIWDIYSDNPNGEPAYEFDFRTGQCTNIGSSEGVCYTREHSFCRSWFNFNGDDKTPYHNDIFHLYPVDGWINTKRGNVPYGKIATASQTFSNGSKMGANTYSGSDGKTCFEPIDSFKGDIARSFFYMAARYMFEDGTFASSDMTLKSQLRPWAVKMLLEWHELDPVSQKEIDRNNAIYAVQRNRNPFIDHPEWVKKIWGNDSINPVQITPANPPEKPKVSWSALTDSRTLKITFTQPMVAWTTENPLNYYISQTVAVTSLKYQNDTLTVHIGGLFSQNTTYNLSIKHLLSKNMAFIDDATVSFFYPYQIEQKPLLAWTFDDLPASPNTPNRISANYYLSDTISEAVLYADGSYQSSVFLSTSSGTELNSFTGTTEGDPRPTPIRGRDIAFVNPTANGKSVVFKFPTKGYFNLVLSMAVQISASGFSSHKWEWSLDGEIYTLIENTTTCPLVPGSPHVLTTLDLRAIDELDDREVVFLRVTFDGCTSASGNNRFDNITLRGVLIQGNQVNEEKKKSNQLTIAPNPTSGQFQISIHNYNPEYYNTDYVIYNSFGQKIKTGKLDNSFIIDISEHPNGIYFCKILGESLKIVKY